MNIFKSLTNDLKSQYFVSFVILISPLLLEVNCRSVLNKSSPENTSIDPDTFIRLNQALDRLLVQLYGDIEPRQELFWEPQHSNHIGDDNALHYTNEWLVHVSQGKEAADHLAVQSGYENLGEVRDKNC
jgi:hypothetical protein